ncbi:MFS transporter [Deltaproteobacteria bacterium]|nr:MFS transporter [Deltaproteobacteria bacterium]
MAASTFGLLASIPGQTMGVGVFSEYLISKTGLNRIELSFAYMMGTILSSLILPFAGKLLDRIGERVMILATGIGLGLSLLFFAQTVTLINSLSPVFSGFLPHSFLALLVMTLAFMLLRQFGQGIMAMVSRNVLAKWFDAKRGLVTGISGIFVSFGFSAAPLGINILINMFGFLGTILLLSATCGFGMALIGWLFFRDRPEECGLFMDGSTKAKASEHFTTPERDSTLSDAVRSYNFWIFCLGMCSSSLIVTGFTFHIDSIAQTSGLSRTEAYSIFLPMSLVSVVSYFLSGWASDRMSLKYLLITLLTSLSIGCLGMLAFETNWSRIIVIICFGVQGGLWGCLSLVTWPRFYGRKHLGAISGLFMSCQVFASAIGPPVFGVSEYYTGNYHNAAWAMAVLNMVLLIGSFRARSFYKRDRYIATSS